MKKRIIYPVIVVLIISTGCRSIGSWYGRTPPPEKTLDLNEVYSQGYTGKRIFYNEMVYDLIIIDPSIIDLQIINIERKKGLSFSDLIKSTPAWAIQSIF